MKNLSIKRISFYGFFVVFVIFVTSGLTMFTLSEKYGKLNKRYQVLENSYRYMFEYKYFTERLLTTYDLVGETKLWMESKDKFQNVINRLSQENYKLNEDILNFFNVIKNESNKIFQKLQNPIFQKQNIMEKSILRRLGEGLNSNEKSDYYLAIVDLKNSIDYLKQYEEFLLEEIKELSIKNEAVMEKQVLQIKQIGIITLLFVMGIGGVVIFLILQQIGKTEKKLIDTKEDLAKTNQALVIQQNELKSIFDNIPNMIFLKDAKDLRFVKINNFGEKLLGKSQEELIGKNDYDLFSQEEADFFINRDKEALKYDRVVNIEEEAITTSAGERILHTRKVSVKDSDGNPLYLLGISEDITDKKEQEKIILEQSKNAAMGEMIGNIAHQWRQPLSIISTGATGMIMQKQMDMLSDEQFENTCNLINDNAQYLSKTIDDFKNFIKNERKFSTFNLEEKIDNFLRLVEPSFKRHDIELVLNIDPSLTIDGYPNELIQCFMNIYNNAKDALKESNQEKKYIFMDSYKKDKSIIIKFRDNAGGIPSDVLPRIFEPYFTTKHQAQGTGLGLSMTYNLVTEGMKGKIIADNVNYNYKGEVYNGAEFTIVLPV